MAEALSDRLAIAVRTDVAASAPGSGSEIVPPAVRAGDGVSEATVLSETLAPNAIVTDALSAAVSASLMVSLYVVPPPPPEISAMAGVLTRLMRYLSRVGGRSR
jgi:hypothetical protein